MKKIGMNKTNLSQLTLRYSSVGPIPTSSHLPTQPSACQPASLSDKHSESDIRNQSRRS